MTRQNSWKGWGIGLALTGVLSSSVLQAQTFEEYMQAQNAAYNNWKSEQDQAFYQFLKADWQTYRLNQGETVQRIKPETMPIAQLDLEPTSSQPAPESIQPIAPTPMDSITKPAMPTQTIEPPKPIEVTPELPQQHVEQPNLVAPIPATPVPLTTSPAQIAKPTPETAPIIAPVPAQIDKPDGVPMTFYGRVLYWPIDASWMPIKQFQAKRIHGDTAAEFWKVFAGVNTAKVIRRFREHAQKLNLNGWGEIQLAYDLSKKLTRGEQERLLLTWALMNRIDKAVRLGFEKHRFYVLYASKQPLYNVKFWKYNGIPYYLFEPDGSRLEVKNLFSYQGQLASKASQLDLNYHQVPKLFKATQTQTLAFKHLGKSYSFDVPVSEPMADYLYTLPLQAVPTYFSRQPSPELKEALIPQLKTAMQDMDEAQKVNFLLALVQKGLKYKLDKNQFNRSEKYLMPEETLWHVYSDCEDHSFLFAWLVKETIGTPMVGLDYPGHIATAVYLPEATKQKRAKHYRYQDKYYVVADPTYINAPYGLEMPQFRNQKVDVIPIP